MPPSLNGFFEVSFSGHTSKNVPHVSVVGLDEYGKPRAHEPCTIGLTAPTLRVRWTWVHTIPPVYIFAAAAAPFGSLLITLPILPPPMMITCCPLLSRFQIYSFPQFFIIPPFFQFTHCLLISSIFFQFAGFHALPTNRMHTGNGLTVLPSGRQKHFQASKIKDTFKINASTLLTDYSIKFFCGELCRAGSQLNWCRSGLEGMHAGRHASQDMLRTLNNGEWTVNRNPCHGQPQSTDQHGHWNPWLPLLVPPTLLHPTSSVFCAYHPLGVCNLHPHIHVQSLDFASSYSPNVTSRMVASGGLLLNNNTASSLSTHCLHSLCFWCSPPEPPLVMQLKGAVQDQGPS
mmetsp:Transcript_52092/g.92881  ORF Transcript_52092/g.92881 Transcript_52092/m.92881 type:complete len:345 (-) Transcript_52092:419-1453(-)